MKLAFALKIVAHAVESSSELSLSVCEGQCPDPLATCTETGDSEFGFVCNCPIGYSWMESSGHCEDVDECIEGFNGFMGNELCNADGGTAYICVNLIGAFTCGCNSGYNFFLDTHECEDIDECADGTSGCEFGCTNLQGSFKCDHPCQGRCNDPLATCEISYENGFGYECICHEGFMWDDGVTFGGIMLDGACIDIDECATGGVGADICNAGAICENTIGSFHCGCAAGVNQGKISMLSQQTFLKIKLNLYKLYMDIY